MLKAGRRLKMRGKFDHPELENELITKNNPRIVAFFDSLERIEVALEQMIEKCKPPLNGERYLTDKELSEILKVNRRTLQEWRNNGQLNFLLLGGKILYRQSDIQDMLDKAYHKAWKQ